MARIALRLSGKRRSGGGVEGIIEESYVSLWDAVLRGETGLEVTTYWYRSGVEREMDDSSSRRLSTDRQSFEDGPRTERPIDHDDDDRIGEEFARSWSAWRPKPEEKGRGRCKQAWWTSGAVPVPLRLTVPEDDIVLSEDRGRCGQAQCPCDEVAVGRG